MRFIDRSFGEITIRAENLWEFDVFHEDHKKECLIWDRNRRIRYYAINGILVMLQEPLKVIKERVESHLVGDRYVKKTVCSEE